MDGLLSGQHLELCASERALASEQGQKQPQHEGQGQRASSQPWDCAFPRHRSCCARLAPDGAQPATSTSPFRNFQRAQSLRGFEIQPLPGGPGAGSLSLPWARQGGKATSAHLEVSLLLCSAQHRPSWIRDSSSHREVFHPSTYSHIMGFYGHLFLNC